MEEVLSRGRDPNLELRELLKGDGVVRSEISTNFVDVMVGPRGACIHANDYGVLAVVLTREDLKKLLCEMGDE